MSKKEELLRELSRCVSEMDDESVVSVAQEFVALGFDPYEGIVNGLVDGMNQASELYEEEEYFIPELLICSNAMYAGLDILKPLLPRENFGNGSKVAIGVVKGDTHDIGKNLVKIMLESAGYAVLDLGRDVDVESFILTAKDPEVEVIGMSTLMSTSMNHMKLVINRLEEENLRDRVKVIVGGGPISPGFAEKIGADGYSKSAGDAVRLVDELLGIRR